MVERVGPPGSSPSPGRNNSQWKITGQKIKTVALVAIGAAVLTAVVLGAIHCPHLVSHFSHTVSKNHHLVSFLKNAGLFSKSAATDGFIGAETMMAVVGVALGALGLTQRAGSGMSEAVARTPPQRAGNEKAESVRRMFEKIKRMDKDELIGALASPDSDVSSFLKTIKLGDSATPAKRELSQKIKGSNLSYSIDKSNFDEKNADDIKDLLLCAAEELAKGEFSKVVQRLGEYKVYFKKDDVRKWVDDIDADLITELNSTRFNKGDREYRVSVATKIIADKIKDMHGEPSGPDDKKIQVISDLMKISEAVTRTPLNVKMLKEIPIAEKLEFEDVTQIKGGFQAAMVDAAYLNYTSKDGYEKVQRSCVTDYSRVVLNDAAIYKIGDEDVIEGLKGTEDFWSQVELIDSMPKKKKKAGELMYVKIADSLRKIAFEKRPDLTHEDKEKWVQKRLDFMHQGSGAMSFALYPEDNFAMLSMRFQEVDKLELPPDDKKQYRDKYEMSADGNTFTMTMYKVVYSEHEDPDRATPTNIIEFTSTITFDDADIGAHAVGPTVGSGTVEAEILPLPASPPSGGAAGGVDDPDDSSIDSEDEPHI